MCAPEFQSGHKVTEMAGAEQTAQPIVNSGSWIAGCRLAGTKASEVSAHHWQYRYADAGAQETSSVPATLWRNPNPANCIFGDPRHGRPARAKLKVALKHAKIR
jgi:hypothetical protein